MRTHSRPGALLALALVALFVQALTPPTASACFRRRANRTCQSGTVVVYPPFKSVNFIQMQGKEHAAGEPTDDPVSAGETVYDFDALQLRIIAQVNTTYGTGYELKKVLYKVYRDGTTPPVRPPEDAAPMTPRVHQYRPDTVDYEVLVDLRYDRHVVAVWAEYESGSNYLINRAYGNFTVAPPRQHR